ncbi:MAG: hypothetical protein QOF60_817 [Actinomycetota bacterium]|jgi:hypothetical protein|nr:hypothetical protein [Actinomycetota bacterium]
MEPLGYVALVVAVAAAILLVSGVLYGFATVAATGGGSTERFRLLGQAASPFVGVMVLFVCAFVVHERRTGRVTQVLGPAALGIAATVGVATVLLALNALILDFTGDQSASFKISAAISRLATVLLAASAVWLAATAPPAGE